MYGHEVSCLELRLLLLPGEKQSFGRPRQTGFGDSQSQPDSGSSDTKSVTCQVEQPATRLDHLPTSSSPLGFNYPPFLSSRRHGETISMVRLWVKVLDMVGIGQVPWKTTHW